MNPWQIVRTALRSLTANKLRSFLTILGVVIGVSAVIALMALGEGTQASIVQNIESLGTNLLFVSPGASSESGFRGAQGSAQTLTLEDAEALEAAPAVAAVAPQVSTSVQAVAGGVNTRAQVAGVTPDYEQVRNLSLAEGRFISESDMDQRTAVVMLGSSVAETLFGETDPVGQSVKLGSRPFTVIGVLESKGGMGYQSEDYGMFAPITTVMYRLSAQRSVSGEMLVSTVYVQAASTEQIDAAMSGMTSILRERHGIALGEEDDFSITSLEDMIETLNAATGVLVLFLGAIAGISLLVGGIGVMNIMLVSVTERTREIGIRKAVGAKRRDILLQFLVESASMSLIGGGIGVLVGWGLSSLVGGLSTGAMPIQAVMSPYIVILAVGVSVLVGVVFGLYPAYRASRLSPVDALRYE